MTAPTQPAATFLGRVIEEFNLNTQDPFTRLLAACFAFQDERDSLRNAVSLAVEQNTALRAEVAALRKWNADMVAKVAEGSLDGYRELGAKCAALEAERDALRRVVAAADAMLENMHE